MQSKEVNRLHSLARQLYAFTIMNSSPYTFDFSVIQAEGMVQSDCEVQGQDSGLATTRKLFLKVSSLGNTNRDERSRKALGLAWYKERATALSRADHRLPYGDREASLIWVVTNWRAFPDKKWDSIVIHSGTVGTVSEFIFLVSRLFCFCSLFTVFFRRILRGVTPTVVVISLDRVWTGGVWAGSLT